MEKNTIYETLTICRIRLAVRTPDSHSGNTGSTPVFGTKIKGIIKDSFNFNCLAVFINAFLFQAISAIIKS